MNDTPIDNSINELIADRFGKNWSMEEERTLLDSYRQWGPDWPRIEALLPLRKGIVSKWKRLVANGNKEAIAIQKYWRSVRDQIVFEHNIKKALSSPDGQPGSDDGNGSVRYNNEDGGSTHGDDNTAYPTAHDDGIGEGEITVDAEGNIVTVNHSHLNSSPGQGSIAGSIAKAIKESSGNTYGTRSTRGANSGAKRSRNDDDFDYYTSSNKSHRGGNNVRTSGNGISSSVYGLSTEDISALLNENNDNNGGDKSDGGDALDRTMADGTRSGLDTLIETTAEQLAEMDNHGTVTSSTTTTTTLPGSSKRRSRPPKESYHNNTAQQQQQQNTVTDMTASTNLVHMMNNLDPTMHPMINLGTPIGTPMGSMLGGGHNPMMMNNSSVFASNGYYPGYNYSNPSMFPYASYPGNSNRFFPQSSMVPNSFYPTNYSTSITTTTVDPTATNTSTATVVPPPTINSMAPSTAGNEGVNEDTKLSGTENGASSTDNVPQTTVTGTTPAATNIPLATDSSGTNALKIDPNVSSMPATTLSNAQLANAMVLQDSGRFKRVTIVIDVPVPNLPSNFVSPNPEETEQWISQYAESYAENFAHAYAKAMQGAYVRGYMDFMQVSSPQHYGEMINMISPTMSYAAMAQNFGMGGMGGMGGMDPMMMSTSTGGTMYPSATDSSSSSSPSSSSSMMIPGGDNTHGMVILSSTTNETGASNEAYAFSSASSSSSGNHDSTTVITNGYATSLTVDTSNHDSTMHTFPVTNNNYSSSSVTSNLQEMRIEESPTVASVSLTSTTMLIDPTHEIFGSNTPHQTTTMMSTASNDGGIIATSVAATPLSLLSPSGTSASGVIHDKLCSSSTSLSSSTATTDNHQHHENYTTLHSH